MNKCNLCDKEFEYACLLLRHKNNKISCNLNKESFNCNLCKVNFKHKSKFKRHEKTKIHIDNINKKNISVKKNILEYKIEENNLKLENDLLKKKIKFQKLEKDNEIMNLRLEIQRLKQNKDKNHNLTGNIYKIEYNKNPNIRYIGSTIKTLKNRYSSHKTKYNKWLTNDDYAKCEIYEYFKVYGIENFNITLLKEYNILNKDHLLVYEQLWINKLDNININKAFAPINIEQHKLKYESLLKK